MLQDFALGALSDQLPRGLVQFLLEAGTRSLQFRQTAIATVRIRPVRSGEGLNLLPQAVDFTAGYNVNSIVVAVPIPFLAGTTGADVFDVWTTVSLPGGVGSAN